MPREISGPLRRAIEEPRTQEYIVVLLEISHPSLAEPIRVANDVVDYVYPGGSDNIYIGFPFDIELVGDNTRTPRGQLKIQNVDRRIGEAVLNLTSPPQLTIMLFAQSDFHEATIGERTRDAVSGISPEYEASHLVFANISVDAMSISGEIESFNMSNEPWPAIRSTADRLPGLDP
jgi:uncharacterized protein DUF1833